MMENLIHFEDYEAGQVRTTPGRTVTEADIVFHAGHSGDFYPHHVDQEFCKTLPHAQRIAHGTLTFLFAVGLQANCGRIAGHFEGFQRLRFIKPVFIGDTLTVRLTVLRKKTDGESKGVVTEKCEAINQQGELVFVMEQSLRVRRRQQDDSSAQGHPGRER